MLNQAKTHDATEAVRVAYGALARLQSSSDSAHSAELGGMIYRAGDLLADLMLLAEREGFHPETCNAD